MTQTPNKLFGLADPQYDALRVLSTQALQIGSVDNTTSAGGGLDNKIYLWPADGSTIMTYAATQAGLIAALAAATTGDTVWLPSIPIALTAGVTIPAGAALAAISENSILNFSGFSGVAVTLSVGSIAHRPIINFVATGTDATGILADAADCVVLDAVVNVSGATATNIAIGAGSTLGANEIWMLLYRIGSGYSIAWSDNFDFSDAVNDTTWYAIESWPVGFDDTVTNRLFAMNYDGSDFYIAAPTQIWRCTNVPAIRAAPATTPTYEIVLDSTDDIDIGGNNPMTIVAITWWNDRLCVILRTTLSGYYYGEYLGGSWTWTNQGYDTTGYRPVTYRVTSNRTGVALDTMHVYNPVTLATYFDAACGFGGSSVQEIWRNHDSGSSAFFTVWKANTATTKIVNKDGNVLHDTGLTEKSATAVTGAVLGSMVFVVMQDGELFVSEDGATFTAKGTWQSGTVWDTYLYGGGNIVWIDSGISESGEVVHISLDRGATTSDKTGDLWSAIGATGSGLNLKGSQLIFL